MNLQTFQVMDANLLLSIVNMKLRNDYRDLNDLARYYDIDQTELSEKLAEIGYYYRSDLNQFTAD